jgi:glycosyltransferase involved in cell wall biosynthesis
MKILVTTFTFFPNKDGVAVASATLCDFLLKSGHKVHVATSRVAGASATSRRKGISIRRFAIYNSAPSDRSSHEISKYLKYLVTEDFDLIINQNWDSWTTELFLKVSRMLRAKRVLVSHGLCQHIYRFHWHPFWGLGQWFRGLLWSFSFLPRLISEHDHFVFLHSYADFGRFLDVGICRLFAPKKVHFIPNSISDLPRKKIRQLFRKHFFPGVRFLLVYVANFYGHKDQARAIRVFAASAVPFSSLVLIGSERNDYSQLITKQAEALRPHLSRNNQSIHIFTGLSRQRVFEVFSCADAFLLTAKHEVMPLVLIESMALKKPWVSTISGCIDKMEGGLPCHTDNQLIKAIRKISLSKQLRKNLAAKGTRAFAKNYSSEAFTLRWKKLIEQILLPEHPQSKFLS